MANSIKNEYIPTHVSHPGLTLIDLLEEKAMSQADLAERTGRPKKTINEIIRGKTSITPETAIQLERVFKLPASFWNSRQSQYDEHIARHQSNEELERTTAWLGKLPLLAMIKSGWIEKKGNKSDQLEEVLRFFSISAPAQWNAIWENSAAAFRKSIAFTADPYSVSAWLRAGEIEAGEIECKPFVRDGFLSQLEAVRHILMNKPRDVRLEIQSRFASAGVAVVTIPPISGVPVFGATRWLTPNKALIQLSLRGKFEDLLWFTIFHEAGHIVLHGKRDTFIESNDNKSKKELEADRFARDFLIPMSQWERFITKPDCKSLNNIISFSKELDISPSIIVGRLQHERLLTYRSSLNKLKRRFCFAE